ncbi:MAG: PilW family protein [Candidatus Accumulibacter sp.]|jgi:type IV pilus assembly protein PilW|nr:PilW family protein [Accumulibacter sp.]
MMRTSPHFLSPKARHSGGARGFSLVEIMVALVIGMIGVLVIMQVARTGEAQKRVTTGSGEAQNNGALAIYSVERDVKQAGYGFSSPNAIGCKLVIPARDPVTAHTLDVLAPVIINGGVPAGDDNTDTLLIVYGNGAGSPEGDIIADAGVMSGNQRMGVVSVKNFRVGEWVFAAPPDLALVSACDLKMGRVTGLDPSPPAIPTTLKLDSNIGASDDWHLFDLGVAPRIVGYAVRGGNLTTCDYMLANCSDADQWTIVANGIVSLRAQYGHDTAGGRAWNATSPVLPSGDSGHEAFAKAWAAIPAVRFALVARNGEPSRESVTASPPTWTNGAVWEDGTLPGNLDGDNWQRYRYQVYETVVPLRNIPWMGS